MWVNYNMNIKQLCTEYNIPYNAKNPKRSLDKLRKEYIVAEVSPKNYIVERPLTDDEKATITKFTKCREMLQDVICVQLAESKTNTIRSDTKGFLEMFGVVNNKYRYFAYDGMNESKLELLNNLDVPNAVLSVFYTDVHPVLNGLLKSVFRKMESELLIMKQDVMMCGVYENYVDFKTGEHKTRTRKFEPSADEKENFLRIARNVMLNNNIKSWDNANYFQRKYINDEACRQMGWAFVYNDYILTLNRSGIKDLVADKQLLNNEVCKKVLMSKQGKLKDYDKDTLTICINALIKTT